MQLTSNLNLKKPESTDNVNIDDLNGNADILDAAVAGKVDKVAGKGLSTEDFTATEKSKLAGIAAGAQVNTVNSVAGKTGAVTLTKSDVGLGNVDNVQQAPISHVGAGGNTAHPDATTSTSGFMTAAMVTKLNGMATGAQINRTIATQAQAESGTDNTTDMTPLRTAQAIAVMAPIDHVDAWLGTTGGSGTAYTTSANSRLTSYAAGQRLSFQAHATSGANPTLKPGTLAALPIRKPNGNAAELDSGGLYTVIVNVGATAFILQGEGGGAGLKIMSGQEGTGPTSGTFSIPNNTFDFEPKIIIAYRFGANLGTGQAVATYTKKDAFKTWTGTDPTWYTSGVPATLSRYSRFTGSTWNNSDGAITITTNGSGRYGFSCSVNMTSDDYAVWVAIGW